MKSYTARAVMVCGASVSRQKTKRSLDLPFNCEINISADGRRMVARRRDCYLVELPEMKSPQVRRWLLAVHIA